MADAGLVGHQKHGLAFEVVHDGVFRRLPIAQLVVLLLEGNDFLVPQFQLPLAPLQLFPEQQEFCARV